MPRFWILAAHCKKFQKIHNHQLLNILELFTRKSATGRLINSPFYTGYYTCHFLIFEKMSCIVPRNLKREKHSVEKEFINYLPNEFYNWTFRKFKKPTLLPKRNESSTYMYQVYRGTRTRTFVLSWKYCCTVYFVSCTVVQSRVQTKIFINELHVLINDNYKTGFHKGPSQPPNSWIRLRVRVRIFDCWVLTESKSSQIF